MTDFLLTLFLATGLAIVQWSLRREGRVVQFPFLATCVFFGWVLPQLLGLRGSQDLPPGSLDKTILMTTLCLAACWAGYVGNRRAARMLNWYFDRSRFTAVAAIFSAAGAYFFARVGILAPEVIAEHGGNWTGSITVFYFLSRLLTVGFAIALLLLLNRPSVWSLAISLFGLAFYLERILIHGRRAALAELSLMLLLALWFQRRWTPPKLIIVAAAVGAALFVNSVGDYRNTMLGEDRFSWSGASISQLSEIDFYDNTKAISEGRADPHELKNAAMIIDAVDRGLRLDWGLSSWNAFVRAYVPAQYVGTKFKQLLYLDSVEQNRAASNHVPHPGTTDTGMADAFASFWFFGALIFVLIARIMSRWWIAAVDGSVSAQVVVMLSITASLHAITHSTHHFFLVFFELAAFAGPALLAAKAGGWVPQSRPAVIRVSGGT